MAPRPSMQKRFTVVILRGRVTTNKNKRKKNLYNSIFSTLLRLLLLCLFFCKSFAPSSHSTFPSSLSAADIAATFCSRLCTSARCPRTASRGGAWPHSAYTVVSSLVGTASSRCVTSASRNFYSSFCSVASCCRGWTFRGASKGISSGRCCDSRSVLAASRLRCIEKRVSGKCRSMKASRRHPRRLRRRVRDHGRAKATDGRAESTRNTSSFPGNNSPTDS